MALVIVTWSEEKFRFPKRDWCSSLTLYLLSGYVFLNITKLSLYLITSTKHQHQPNYYHFIIITMYSYRFDKIKECWTIVVLFQDRPATTWTLFHNFWDTPAIGGYFTISQVKVSRKSLRVLLQQILAAVWALHAKLSWVVWQGSSVFPHYIMHSTNVLAKRLRQK